MRWIVAMTFLLLSLSGCAPKALYLSPNYPEIRPHQITILPILDHRVNKSDEVGYQDAIGKAAKTILEQKRYHVDVAADFGDQLEPGDEITPGDLASPNPTWLKTLGPPDSRWIMLGAVTYMRTTFYLIGTYLSGEVEGYLFDKFTGELLWHGKGKASQHIGLLLSPLLPIADEDTLRMAAFQMMSSVPNRN